MLGAGRKRSEDAVLSDVGVIVLRQVGESVQENDPILEVHHRDSESLTQALPLFEGAIEIGDSAPSPKQLILEQLGAMP